MSSRREQVIQAVLALVTAALPAAEIRRNTETPERVPTGGLAILRDGDPGEPEELLSPRTFLWTHPLSLELVAPAGPSQEDFLDSMLIAVGNAIEADLTLGGLADWVQPTAPTTSDATAQNAQPVRWAVLDIVVMYPTPTPLT